MIILHESNLFSVVLAYFLQIRFPPEGGAIVDFLYLVQLDETSAICGVPFKYSLLNDNSSAISWR